MNLLCWKDEEVMPAEAPKIVESTSNLIEEIPVLVTEMQEGNDHSQLEALDATINILFGQDEVMPVEQPDVVESPLILIQDIPVIGTEMQKENEEVPQVEATKNDQGRDIFGSEGTAV